MDAVLEFLRTVWGPWLMVVFLGIVLWAFWPRNKGRFESYGDIPLRDEENKER